MYADLGPGLKPGHYEPAAEGRASALFAAVAGKHGKGAAAASASNPAKVHVDPVVKAVVACRPAGEAEEPEPLRAVDLSHLLHL